MSGTQKKTSHPPPSRGLLSRVAANFGAFPVRIGTVVAMVILGVLAGYGVGAYYPFFHELALHAKAGNPARDAVLPGYVMGGGAFGFVGGVLMAWSVSFRVLPIVKIWDRNSVATHGLLLCLTCASCGMFGLGASPAAVQVEERKTEVSRPPRAIRDDSLVEFGPVVVAHRVALDPFALEKTEVTVAAYRECLSAGACSKPADDPRIFTIDREANDLPVNGVSRLQAAAYCTWAGRRLPTAAEWLWAAQGREEARPHPWGREAPSCDRVHLVQLADADAVGCAPQNGAPGIARVGAHPAGASRDGLLDMAGNLAEWTSTNKSRGIAIMGTWESRVGVMWERPEKRSHLIGFRCAESRPAVEVPGAIGRDGVLVAEVRSSGEDPFWKEDAVDFEYSCHAGVGGVEDTRHVRVGTGEVAVYDRAGSNTVVKTVHVAPGPVRVKNETVLSVPERAYLTKATTTCTCSTEMCMLEEGKRPLVATFAADELLIPVQESTIGDIFVGEAKACRAGEAEWECADDRWLQGPGMECFRGALEPLEVRAPAGTTLGWWIELEEGWVRGDGQFDLEVMCSGQCEALANRCVSERECATVECEAGCVKEHEGCEPEWTSAAFGG